MLERTYVQAREVADAKLVENGRVGVARMITLKRGLGGSEQLDLGARDAHAVTSPLISPTGASMSINTILALARPPPIGTKPALASVKARRARHRGWRPQAPH